jgi:hypothetical protein
LLLLHVCCLHVRFLLRHVLVLLRVQHLHVLLLLLLLLKHCLTLSNSTHGRWW